MSGAPPVADRPAGRQAVDEAARAARGADDDLAVVTSGLTKRFRSGQVAVDAVDLAVPRGSVYGFLGPNGSGKTTTIRLLLGLARPTTGSARVLGLEVPQHSVALLPRVGALVEGPGFHGHLSGTANLVRLDAADPTADPRTAAARIGAALERVGLTAAATKRYRHYSLGMRQRLGIAGALLRPRDLLVLDEPTNGLDPQGTREVRTLIGELAASGMTVLLSTHLLGEVEQVATHVGVMRAGRLVAQGPLESLRAAAGASPAVERVVVSTAQAAAAAAVLRAAGARDVRERPDGAEAELGGAAPEDLVDALVAAGVRVRGFTAAAPPAQHRLEDAFVALTGEGFDVDG